MLTGAEITKGRPDAPLDHWIDRSQNCRSGIFKTSAVINVGTATIAAFIGAEGFGQPILTGIRLNDIGLIKQGAVPSTLLALAVQGLFDLSGRWLVLWGLRLGSGS